jgi:translation initiation factor 2D
VLYYDQHGLEPLWITIIPPGRRDEVLEKLQGGADLMTPGLTSWSTAIKSGDIVAVTLQNDVPVAVGVAGFDIGRLSKAAGQRGKAVYIVHCYNDDLWSLGSKTKPPAALAEPVVKSRVEEVMEQLSLNTEEEEDNSRAETLPEPPAETNKSENERDVEPAVAGMMLTTLVLRL